MQKKLIKLLKRTKTKRKRSLIVILGDEGVLRVDIFFDLIPYLYSFISADVLFCFYNQLQIITFAIAVQIK